MSEIKSKEELRTWAKNIRKTLDLDKISIQAQQKIKDLDIYKSAKTVMSYMAKDSEVSLSGLFEDKSKEWFLPVVRQQSEIVVVPYDHGKTKLIKGLFGINEPEVVGDNFYDQKEKKRKLDLIFVPGLSFTKDGHRLGFGKGYYDRFFKINTDSFKVGFCPRQCLVDKLPTDAWDIKVDLVIEC